MTGLIAPANDNASPLRVDVAALFSDPAKAIGRFHRGLLLDATHNWSFMLQEVAALLGLGGAIAGAGTSADPILSLRGGSVLWASPAPTT